MVCSFGTNHHFNYNCKFKLIPQQNTVSDLALSGRVLLGPIQYQRLILLILVVFRLAHVLFYKRRNLRLKVTNRLKSQPPFLYSKSIKKVFSLSLMPIKKFVNQTNLKISFPKRKHQKRTKQNQSEVVDPKRTQPYRSLLVAFFLV